MSCRMTVLFGVCFGVATFADTVSGQSPLRKMRIVSGVVGTIDYGEKSFDLNGIKSATFASELRLQVDKATKGLDFLEEKAKVTVLFDDFDKLAVSIRLTGSDAEGQERDELDTVRAPRETKKSTDAKKKPKKSSKGSESTPIMPPAPPLGSTTYSGGGGMVSGGGGTYGPAPAGPDPYCPEAGEPPGLMPEETFDDPTMNEIAEGIAGGDDPGVGDPANPGEEPGADPNEPGADPNEPGEDPGTGEEPAGEEPPATGRPPGPERPPRSERPPPERVN